MFIVVSPVDKWKKSMRHKSKGIEGSLVTKLVYKLCFALLKC